MRSFSRRPRYPGFFSPAVFLLVLAFCLMAPAWAEAKTVTANVALVDHVLVFNRLGAQNVNGMIYALERDLVNNRLREDKRPRPLVLRVSAGDTLVVNFRNGLTAAANPNPMPLPDEANPVLAAINGPNDQVAGRFAGFHVQGMQLVGSIASDASNVGKNDTSLVGPGQSKAYTYLAEKEGTFLVTSYGATFGGEATGGNVGVGAFAVVTVEPPGAKYYRSQVTEEELRLASSSCVSGSRVQNLTSAGQPIVNYEATYPATNCDGSASIWVAEGKAGLPILNMLDAGGSIVHSDINAIIAGTEPDGSFPPGTYPLAHNPTVPNRLEPFREFTVVFHDETVATNAFPAWFPPNLPIGWTTHGVRDSFMINYGSGGIGSEIIANRLGVGPMWDCLNCSYEEFFLTSFAVGDPAMLVDEPANSGLEACGPDLVNCADVGPKATKAFYPDDPSNVHHSYTGDFTKYRNLHAGPKEQHIFHLHNHQWLFNANDDNSNYLDAQGVGPGSGYTYEINFGGSGNRNKTAGDAIFHCHFYPHFAQGMWELWRNHDVLETGTVLAVSGGTAEAPGIHGVQFALKDGTPAIADEATGARVRALPDGEILVGTPIPAVVPLPGKAMPPMPGRVTIVTKNTNPGVDDDPVAPGVQELPETSVANVDRDDLANGKNPGFPFWIAGVDCGGPAGLGDPTGCRDGIVGQRPTTPPMDMMTVADATALVTSGNPLFQHPGFVTAAGGFDGGLPRHALEGFKASENLDDLGNPIPGRTDSTVVVQNQTRFDFLKVIHKAKPVYFPEEGTDVEQAAMRFHAEKSHATFKPNGGAAQFRTNGALPVPGAPFMEPCIDDQGDLFMTGGNGQFFGAAAGSFFNASPQFGADNPRVYKAANIQIDAVFNKVGYHFPQQRIISLWGDVADFVSKAKPPEPFVLRMNTFDCTQYYHSNLVPNVYELDDYQVRTPTDIIGQHIHLPKWDLTTADGAANGWNYEDGTLSPGSVEERIAAINAYNAAATNPVGTLPKPSDPPTFVPQTQLAAANHPFFGEPGARITLQRWFSDPVVNTDLEDRGLGIIFTHDHYGPSTHQQIGLYGTVLTEPARSIWKHNETGVQLASRPSDGGPTSWQAIIQPTVSGGAGQVASPEPYREFYFEFSDFQHAYVAGAAGILNVDAPDANSFRSAINPSFRQEAPLPDILRFPPFCPGGVPRPCPEAISADDVGMLVVNYRNEPVGLRVFDPKKIGPDGKLGTQAGGLNTAGVNVPAAAGDLAFALQSRTDRAIAEMNVQPAGANFPPPINAAGAQGPGDPFTPMMRVYPSDLVRVKIQSGATEHEHDATIHGMKWLQGGSGHGTSPNSGWRNSQNDGISEQFTFRSPVNADVQRVAGPADYAYSIDASQDGWWSGTWGVLRNYDAAQPNLQPLPGGFTKAPNVANSGNFAGVCPATPQTVNLPPGQRVPANLRPYTVIAMTANELLPKPAGVTIPANLNPVDNVGGPLNPLGGSLVYNPRAATAAFQGPLHDPTALMFVNAADLVPVNPADRACRDTQGRPGVANPQCRVKLRAGVNPEPLVLRAAAGDCVEVRVFNRLPAVAPDLAGYNTLLQMVQRDPKDPQGVTTFNNNLIRPSSNVGLHPQLVEYDVTKHDGANVGVNRVQTVAPGGQITYRWYAGDLDFQKAGNGVNIVATPVEFGGANLMPADKIKQGQKGMVGALIIEPRLATWTEDPGKRAAATVTPPGGSAFRDFAVVFQKGLNLRYGSGAPVENIAAEGGAIPEDAHDAGQKGINYGTEPAWYRFGLAPNVPFGNVVGGLGGVTNPELFYDNDLAGGDPATPVFTAGARQEVRMRVLEPTGVGRGTTFDLHGHLWQRNPYLAGKVPSQTIGDNLHDPMYLGHQESVTPSAHFDIVLPSAGGVNGVAGDYLFRDHGSFGNTDGLWGILRVE
jgi:manganese oxidase